MFGFDEEEVKPAPDFSKITNPEVRQYMMNKYQKEQELATAKEGRDINAYAGIAGKALEGLNQPTNIRYENSFKNLGNAPKRSVGEAFKYDNTDGEKYTEQKIKDSEGALAKTKADFNDKVAMENYSRSEADYAEDSNPQSAVSKQYQALAGELMPGKDFSTVSAKKLKELMPPLEKLYQHRNKPKAAGQETWASTGMVDEEGYLILNNKFTGENKKGAKVGKKPGAGSGEKPKPHVNSQTAGDVGKFDSAMTLVDDLDKAWGDKTGTFSIGTQYLPNTDAGKYNDQAKIAAQTIGSILEGGKLTDADYDKYLKMLPTPGDSKATKDNKIAAIRRQIELKKKGAIDGMTQAGFNTSGFDNTPSQPAGGPSKRKATTFDQLPD